MVRARVNQLQTAAAFVRPMAPASAGRISDVVDVDINRVGFHPALLVGGDDLVRHGQCNALAFGKLAAEITHRIRAGQVWITGHQVRRVLRNDQIAISREHRVRREREINAVAEFPATEAHRSRSLVVKLDVFIIAVPGDRRIHDFVEDDVADASGAVRQAGRARFQSVELVRAVGIPSGGNAVLLPAELHGIKHARTIGVFEIDRLAGRAQRESQFGLVKHHEAARLNDRVGWDDELVRVRVIGEDAVGKVRLLIAVVVEFDVIEQRIVRVR